MPAGYGGLLAAPGIDSGAGGCMVAAGDVAQAEALLSASPEPCTLPASEEEVDNSPASGCRFFTCD